MSAVRIVVMGVAGSGKTTVGRVLADAFDARFLDADAVHPPSNIAKMSAGEPLTDDDRWPWLARLRAELRHSDSIVVACSTLKRRYRDLLRHAGEVRFVFLDLDADTAQGRAAHREGHYMGAGMVASQFDALERPGPDETDVVTVDARGDVDGIVRDVVDRLQQTTAGTASVPLLADGGADRDITPTGLAAHVASIVERQVFAIGARRVLLVPPDHTRLHSRAGLITVLLKREIEAGGGTVGVLPALGTHVAMSPADAAVLFGDDIGVDDLLV
ncbi:MAG: gluconokinase, partial [Ilumatobacteraceae bacterium]